MTDTVAQPTAGSPDDVEFLPARARTAPSWLGLVFSIVLIALGVVLVHDALVHLGVVAGEDWITTVARSTGQIRPGGLVAFVGLVLAIVGLMLLFGALRPRRSLGAALISGNGQYLMPADIARLSSAAAKRVDGVLDARSTATTSKVSVVAHITGDPGTSDQVANAVQNAVAVLDRPVKVRVRTRATNEKDAS